MGAGDTGADHLKDLQYDTFRRKQNQLQTCKYGINVQRADAYQCSFHIEQRMEKGT